MPTDLHNLSSHFQPCRLVGDFVSLVETRDVVDSAGLEINASVLTRVDVSADDEAGTFLRNRLRQLR